MAHSLSAKKRIRQSLKRRALNRVRKESVKESVKSFLAIAATDVVAAKAELNKVASRLDKIAAKGTIHKNTAARRRSRLAKRLNALTAAGGTAVAAKAPAKKTVKKAKGKTSAAKA